MERLGDILSEQGFTQTQPQQQTDGRTADVDRTLELKRKRRANRERQRTPAPQPARQAEDVESHWLTPNVQTRRCDCCGGKGCIAYRHSDRSTLCEVCILQLGITPRVSRAWKRAAA